MRPRLSGCNVPLWLLRACACEACASPPWNFHSFTTNYASLIGGIHVCGMHIMHTTPRRPMNEWRNEATNEWNDSSESLLRMKKVLLLVKVRVTHAAIRIPSCKFIYQITPLNWIYMDTQTYYPSSSISIIPEYYLQPYSTTTKMYVLDRTKEPLY